MPRKFLFMLILTNLPQMAFAYLANTKNLTSVICLIKITDRKFLDVYAGDIW